MQRWRRGDRAFERYLHSHRSCAEVCTASACLAAFHSPQHVTLLGAGSRRRSSSRRVLAELNAYDSVFSLRSISINIVVARGFPSLTTFPRAARRGVGVSRGITLPVARHAARRRLVSPPVLSEGSRNR